MTRGRPSSTALLRLRKRASRDPQSCTIASFTDREVVRGPGVRSNGSSVSETAATGMRAFRIAFHVISQATLASRHLSVQYDVWMPPIEPVYRVAYRPEGLSPRRAGGQLH